MIAPDVPDAAIVDAIDAVASAGGDTTQPIAVIDKLSQAPLAVIKQLPDGSIQVHDANAYDIGSIVNKVTGYIDDVAGTLTNIGTQVKKVGNAVQGAAVGAQTGYNAPTDWKPILIGAGALIGGGWLVSKVLR